MPPEWTFLGPNYSVGVLFQENANAASEHCKMLAGADSAIRRKVQCGSVPSFAATVVRNNLDEKNEKSQHSAVIGLRMVGKELLVAGEERASMRVWPLKLYLKNRSEEPPEDGAGK